MYCTNVRNYVIKIHVFDYLTTAATFVWNIMLAKQKAAGFHEGHLFCEASCLDMPSISLFSQSITCKFFGVHLNSFLVQLQINNTVI